MINVQRVAKKMFVTLGVVNARANMDLWESNVLSAEKESTITTVNIIVQRDVGLVFVPNLMELVNVHRITLGNM